MTKAVTIEQIDRFNKMIDALKGKDYYYLLDVVQEVKEDPNPKWFFMGHGKIYLDPANPDNQKYKNHCMKGFPQTVGGLPIPYYSCGDEFEWKERDDA